MSFTIREIEENDLDNGFFETLSNLSVVGAINTKKTHHKRNQKK
jgi:glucosamine-phosphate N-acetyltransferase